MPKSLRAAEKTPNQWVVRRALAGLKDTTTDDTLCAINATIILERIEFPGPVIELSVEPKTKADQEKMGVAPGATRARRMSHSVKRDKSKFEQFRMSVPPDIRHLVGKREWTQSLKTTDPAACASYKWM